MNIKSYKLLSGILIFAFSIIFISCGKDEPGMSEGTINVALDFREYVERFKVEANNRGFNIDFSDTGLSIQYGTLPKDAAGVCSELGDGSGGSHRIEIRKLYWETLTDIQKERLIFHELGHCELSRPHDNKVLSNGDWKSIMRGAPLPEGKTAIVNYTGTRRDYYLDELFTPTTGIPAWLNFSVPYDDVSEDKKVMIFEDTNITEFDFLSSLTRSDNFEIEMEIEVLSGLGFAGISWAGTDVNNSLHLYLIDGKEFHVASGSQLYGILHVFDYPSNIAYQKNKVTIRRVDDFYLIYLNDQFLYWIDYFDLRSASIRSITEQGTGREVDVMYHAIRVFTIN